MSAANAFAVTAPAPDRLAATGAFTFATAAAALAALRQRMPRGAASLDLAGVVQADSAGLAVLLALAGDARRSGATLQIVNAPESLRALAHLAEVDGLLGFA
ncbi:STAS domain-containing protein [Tahibacter harae]|uniref:STAS domain-containing protein n=1 Tax=Tahibacter harae TaxID=2963937 RepID=A0ABT1QR38_9GAMM|nr:STAS domain-containing protein [Tahibacter harae]